jgi:photosystem II stability/assembly factor-like uncharacterized protein
MSNKLKWILGALLLSLGGLIGCGGNDSATTAASTGGSGGSPGTGGGGGGPSPCVGPSGWSIQESVQETYDGRASFDDVHFVDAMIGWVVGREDLSGAASPVILNTTDGGASWTPQTSGTTEGLRSVHFVDAQVGWAVGVKGCLKTTDGGENWISQTGGSYESVHFVDAMNGWVVGFNSIRKTTDGGATWTTKMTGRHFTDVYFIDAQVGWVTSRGQGGDPSQTILRTTDGGENWASSTGFFPVGSYEAVHFVDAMNG